MSFGEMRDRIMELDDLINEEKDPNKKIQLIDESLDLNQQYIARIKRGIPVRVIFCILLSFFYLIGLAIFLPQIIVRKSRISICEDRIKRFEKMKKRLQDGIVEDLEGKEAF